MIHDTVEENGLTRKQNNLNKIHNIPLGSLVQVEFEKHGSAGVSVLISGRMRVIAHARDCDGTPLYTLGYWWPTFSESPLEGGFLEDSLTVIDGTG